MKEEYGCHAPNRSVAANPKSIDPVYKIHVFIKLPYIIDAYKSMRVINLLTLVALQFYTLPLNLFQASLKPYQSFFLLPQAQ